MLKLRDMLKFRPAEMTKWVSSLQSSGFYFFEFCPMSTRPSQWRNGRVSGCPVTGGPQI